MNRLFLFFIISTAIFAQNYQVLKIKGDKVKVRISSISRCHVADLDLIMSEINRDLDDRHNIIATIESLPVSQVLFKGGQSKNLLQEEQQIAKEILQTNFEISVSDIKKNSLAGIFICKDGDKVGSCSVKRLQSFDKMMSEHEIPEDAVDPETGRIFTQIPEPTKQEDRIYYFNPIVVSRGEIKVFNSIKDIKAFQKELLSLVPNDVIGINYAVKGVDILGSIELKVSGDSLVIELPYNDAEKCYGSE